MPSGRETVGIVALGTLGYGVAIVVAIWLYFTDQITWGVARRVVGGVFAVVGTGIVVLVWRAWRARRGARR